MNDVLKERERCVQLIKNAMRRHGDSPVRMELLKSLLYKIQHPKVKSTGKHGGPLPEQLVLPLNNSTDGSASTTI